MSPPPALKPLPIDSRKSDLWAVAGLGSVGAGYGPAGGTVALFDLVNRVTGRAHRMQMVGGSVGIGLPVSGSIGSSPYASFKTSEAVSFFDFDGIWLDVDETNLLIYSFTSLTFHKSKSPISSVLAKTKTIGDLGFSIPSAGRNGGLTKILFTNGKMVDPGGVMLVPPPVDLSSKEELPTNIRYHAPGGYNIPADATFDFDKHSLKSSAEMVLREAANFIEEFKGPSHRIFVTGHTDNIGRPDYNLVLSKRRAEAVARWLIENKVATRAEMVVSGEGEAKPLLPNKRADGADHPYNRERNRRVEIKIM